MTCVHYRRVVTQALGSLFTQVSILWLYTGTDGCRGTKAVFVWSVNCLGLSQLHSRRWKARLNWSYVQASKTLWELYSTIAVTFWT